MKLLYLILWLPSLLFAQKMSVEDCYAYAFKQHPDLQNAVLKEKTAKTQVEIAKNDWIPKLSSSLSSGGNLGRSIDPFSNNIVTNGIGFQSFGLSGNTIIFNGFKQQNTIQKQELLLDIAHLETINADFQQKIAILNAYLRLSLDYESVVLKKEQMEDLGKLFQRTKFMIAEGQAARYTSSEIEAQMMNEEFSLLQLKNRTLTDRVALETLIFWKETRELTIEDRILPVSKMETEMVADALPSIKIGQLNRRVSLLDYEIFKSNFRPMISAGLGFNTSFSSAAPKELTYFKQLNGNIGQFANVSLSMPITFGLQKERQLQVLKINQLTQQNNNQKTAFLAKQEYKKLLSDLALVKEKQQVAQKQINLSTIAFQAAQARFNEGVINFIDFNQISIKLYEAKANLKVANIERIFISKLIELYDF